MPIDGFGSGPDAPASPLRAKRAAGFTLVELLVVLAIIALLVAILLPTLSRARASARTNICLSHIRQMNLMLTAYVSDSDDYMPYRGRLQTENVYWTGKFIKLGLMRPLPHWHTNNRIDWDKAGKDIRLCPELMVSGRIDTMTGSGMAESIDGTGLNAGNGADVCFNHYTTAVEVMGYYRNGDWSTLETAGGRPATPRRISSYASPTRILSFGEVQYWNSATNAVNVNHNGFGNPLPPSSGGYRWRLGPDQMPNNQVYYTNGRAENEIYRWRHGETSNLAFLDGHAENRQFNPNNYGGWGRILETD